MNNKSKSTLVCETDNCIRSRAAHSCDMKFHTQTPSDTIYIIRYVRFYNCPVGGGEVLDLPIIQQNAGI